jgi:hypothetical protein
MYDPLLTVPVLTVPVLTVPVLSVPVLTVPVLSGHPDGLTYNKPRRLSYRAWKLVHRYGLGVASAGAIGRFGWSFPFGEVF